MNRIQKLFQTKKGNILSIYFTAGFKALSDTLPTIRELDKAGVDMIEIGMPFSDPVADGPVIQRSNQKALSNGMTTKLLFEQLARVREITNLPLILMGYLNPVFKFGIENFLGNCQKTGIDGIIIPDLPYEEYQVSYKILFDKYNIFNISLISPQTPDKRIIYLDSVSKGFLYMVSTTATTGTTNNFDESQITYFKRINDLNLNTPRLIGFGISNNETFIQVCNFANGAIIGSSFIRALDEDGTLPENVQEFIRRTRGQT
jgi:tryptophan synthase alpha chain